MKLLRAIKHSFLVLIFGLAMGTGLAAESAKGARPNIIFIIADDLGYGDVQCLNPQRGKILTPNFDRLGREGMIFTDAHGGSSVCTPTRYGIMTGRYAWRTRLQNGVIDGYQPPLIAPDRLTVAALAKQQGYHTAAIGKWHLGFTVENPSAEAGNEKAKSKGKVTKAEKKAEGKAAAVGSVTRDGPTTRGFDVFRGFQHARSMQAYFVNDRVAESVAPVDMLPKIAREASAHIAERAKAGQPFFLYFALSSPHTPIVPSKEWEGKSGLGKYADFVMETDWAVGEVLAALDRAGIADNTLVIATSDNGCSPAAGMDKLESLGHFASAQFRGAKADIWDGGHRIPFLARWPAKVKGGARCETTICLADFMATCADLFKVKVPDNAGEDSFSFLPDLLGTGRSQRANIVHHSASGLFAIREGTLKLEFCPGSGGWGKPKDAEARQQGLPAVQLYDLATDIGEQRNLQAERKDVVTRLTALLEKQVREGRSTPGKPQKNDVVVDFRKAKGGAESAVE